MLKAAFTNSVNDIISGYVPCAVSLSFLLKTSAKQLRFSNDLP